MKCRPSYPLARRSPNGVAGRVQVQSAEEGQNGFYLDPVAMGMGVIHETRVDRETGQTELDDTMPDSLKSAWRIARDELSRRIDPQRLVPLAIRLSPGLQFQFLSGRSASGLLCCVMCAAATETALNTDVSASSCIGLRQGAARRSNGLKPHEIVTLAQLRDPRCKHSCETIAKALKGNWHEEHLFALKQEYDFYLKYQKSITKCGQKIEAEMARFQDKSDGQQLPKNCPRPNLPTFNIRQALYRMTGVDLTVVEGIDAYTALVVVGELGMNLQKHFPTENQFVSWLALCLGTNKTGGRQKSSRTRRSSNRVAAALRMAASSLHHCKSALGAYYRRKQGQIGKPQAVTAVAHKLARLIYKMMTKGLKYVQRGQDEYEEQYRQRKLYNLKRNAKQLGFALVPTTDAPA